MELGSQENIQEIHVFIFFHQIDAFLRWKYDIIDDIIDDINRSTTNSERIKDDFGVSRSNLPLKPHKTLINNISLIFLI